MRDIFHCTPSELKKQSLEDIQAVLVCMDLEHRIGEQKRKARDQANMK